MPQLFSKTADVRLRAILAALALTPFVLTAFGYALVYAPSYSREGAVSDQPIPFSHEHHVGEMGLDCRFCHAGVATRRLAPAPTLNICMTCHSQLWTNARMLEPLRSAWARQGAIEWIRIHRLPDYVYFDHSAHIANGVGCTSCHGDTARMPLMRQAQPLTMDWCVSCHRDPGPHLRWEKDIMDPAPRPENSPEQARALMTHYGIELIGLTDCSTCHR